MKYEIKMLLIVIFYIVLSIFIMRQLAVIILHRKNVKINKINDKMSADIMHDIKNAMATMVSMMEVLENDYYSNDSREIVLEVGKQVKSTFYMVESLLNHDIS